MGTTTETFFDTQENIIKNFNFEKVHAYMVLTGWKWRDETPNIDSLRATAIYLLRQVYDATSKWRKEGDEGQLSGTGGFYAYRFIFGGKVCYKLTFEPFSYSNF